MTQAQVKNEVSCPLFLGRQEGVFDNILEVASNVWIWIWEGGSAYGLELAIFVYDTLTGFAKATKTVELQSGMGGH